MAEVTVTLVDGLVYGKEEPQTHYQVVLRELTAGDVIEAQEAAERPVPMPRGGVQLMVSQSRLSYELLRRQVKRVGDIDGPLSLAELKRLSTGDLERLDGQAQELDAADARGVAEGAESRGRDEPAPGGD